MPAISPVLVNLSRTQRPDALCLDFRTSFSLGPIARQDNSEGNVARVWKTRVDSANNVWLARANDADDGWDAETLVFAFVGVPGLEVDLAFDQNANIVVSLNRATGAGGGQEVWLYYFDSITAAYVFQNFGEGRCAKVVLDDALDVVASDVLLFYMKDSINKLCVRTQRERYLTETPVQLGGGLYVAALNSYVDDVYRAAEGRVHVLVAEDVAGQYNYKHYETTLYPHTLPYEAMSFGVVPLDRASLIVVYITADGETESLQLGAAIQSGTLVLTTIEVPGTLYWLPEEDMQLIVPAIQSGTVVLVVIVAETLEDDMKIEAAIQSGTVVVVVITHTTYDIEQLKLGVDIQSGSLV